MKKFFIVIILLSLNNIIHGQTFQEICQSSTINGTIVDCQHFNDTLYSTGFFNIICGEPVGYLSKWEDNEWKKSSISISDPGHALTVINDKLYIGKYEESIDSNWVYVYDNSSLEKVGQGVYLSTASGFSELPNIYDIIEYNGEIIACGEFDRVGVDSIKGIMKWNGNNWQALGLGLNGNIQSTAPVMFPHQLMVYNSELYVVGNFKNAGNQEVNGIAKWDGASWSNLGQGFNNTVYSIAVFNNEIIVGGSFTESDGTPLNRIAKWDGTSWIPLEFGFSQTSPNDFIFVHTLKVIDNVLYIAGGLKELTYADNSVEVCNGIVSYSNNTINTFMGGVPGFDIEAICKTQDEQLLIGGGVFGNGYAGIIDLSVSNVEHSKSSDIIFPNPFNESIYINSDNNYKHFEIISELGAIIKRGEYENAIELKLKSGIYFLKLIHEDDTFSIHKIVKI